MEDWAETRRLHLAEGIPIKEIARRLGLARNTVRDAVRSSTPPRYERKATGSAVEAAEPDIRRLLARQCSSLPAIATPIVFHADHTGSFIGIVQRLTDDPGPKDPEAGRKIGRLRPNASLIVGDVDELEERPCRVAVDSCPHDHG